MSLFQLDLVICMCLPSPPSFLPLKNMGKETSILLVVHHHLLSLANYKLQVFFSFSSSEALDQSSVFLVVPE